MEEEQEESAAAGDKETQSKDSSLPHGTTSDNTGKQAEEKGDLETTGENPATNDEDQKPTADSPPPEGDPMGHADNSNVDEEKDDIPDTSNDVTSGTAVSAEASGIESSTEPSKMASLTQETSDSETIGKPVDENSSNLTPAGGKRSESSEVVEEEELRDSFADLVDPDDSTVALSESDDAKIRISGSNLIIEADSETFDEAVDSMIITPMDTPKDRDSPEDGAQNEIIESEQFQPPHEPIQVASEEFDRTAEPYLLENNLLAEVDAQVVYALLDEHIQQLEVLGKIISAPYMKDPPDDTETLRERFRRQEDEPIKIKGTHNSFVVPANPSLVKIQQDRAYLNKVIERLMRELRREGSYVPLIDAVNAEAVRREEYVLIEEEAITNSQHITELQKEIRELKASMAVEIAERNNRIFELRDQLQEVLARTGMEVRYTHGSMAARQYSDEARLQMRRLQHRSQAEGARTACDYETRVNTEIDSYLRDTLDKLNDVLDARLTKFDGDTDEKEREISNLKYKKQQNFQVLTEAKENFKLYTRVIAEDDEELRQEEERQALEERREKAATIIQSFWLGYRERKKFRKKLKKMRKAAKKAAKDGKGGGKSPPPKGKKKK